MIKRKIVVGLIALFALASAVCYSCNFNKDKAVLLSGIEDNTESSGADSESGKNYSFVSDSEVLSADDANSGLEKQQPIMITVHICGAVKQPGVYELEEGSRLFDLIRLSGGLDDDAAGDYINQAEKVTDGQRYYIPTVKELENLSVSEKMEGVQSKKDNKDNENDLVNINTADKDELMTLPGIGESKAKSIIDYRNTNGKFKSTDELMNIPGIKEGLFDKIKSMITVK